MIGACAFAGGGESARLHRGRKMGRRMIGACAFAGGGESARLHRGRMMGLFRGIGEQKRGMSKHFDRAFLLMSGVFDGQAAFLSL